MKEIIKRVEDVRDGDWLKWAGESRQLSDMLPTSAWKWGRDWHFWPDQLAALLASPLVECWREVPDKPRVWYGKDEVFVHPETPSTYSPWIHVDTSEVPQGIKVNYKLWPAGEPEPLPEDVAECLRRYCDHSFIGPVCKKYGIEAAGL